MKKIKILLFTLFIVININCKKNSQDETITKSGVGSTLSNSLTNGIDLSKYIFLGEDNFNGLALDTTVWNYRGENTVRGHGIMLRSNVSLTGNGILKLAANRSGNTFSGSMISTEKSFLFKYGYFECRAKLNQSIGPDVAFWLQSPTNGATNNPSIDGVEIDIAEYNHSQGDNNLYHALHWNGYGQFAQSILLTNYIPGISNGFHIFGLEWSPKEYIVYVDGIEKGRTSTAVSHRSEFIILSSEIIDFGGDRFAGTYPDYFDIDYVKIYKPKPVVTLYGDCNYNGWISNSLQVGSYTTAQLSALGFIDNATSSVEVPLGLKITLFSDDNFTGNTKIITSDKPCLTSLDFNDFTSSAIVSLN